MKINLHKIKKYIHIMNSAFQYNPFYLQFHSEHFQITIDNYLKNKCHTLSNYLKSNCSYYAADLCISKFRINPSLFYFTACYLFVITISF